jgi:ribosomal protein L44E
MNVVKAFDATGLNVYKDVCGFGRTKSVSFRLFRAAYNEARVRAVNKSNRREVAGRHVYGVLRYSQGDPVAVRVRKAAKRLRHIKFSCAQCGKIHYRSHNSHRWCPKTYEGWKNV